MSKLARKKKKKTTYILSMLLFIIAGTVCYIKLTGDTTISDKQEYLTIMSMFAGVAVLSMFLAWIIRSEQLAGATMKKIDRMNGVEFEEWLATMYKRHGYRVQLTPATCDFGADLILSKNRMHIAVQAKRYRNQVGEAAIQQAIAAREYYNCDMAAVVTNSTYTKAAIDLAGRANIYLIDRSSLATKSMYF